MNKIHVKVTFMEKSSFGTKPLVCHATWQRFKRPPKGLGVVVEYHEITTLEQFKSFLGDFLYLSEADKTKICVEMGDYLGKYAESDRKRLQESMARLVAGNHRKRRPVRR